MEQFATDVFFNEGPDELTDGNTSKLATYQDFSRFFFKKLIRWLTLIVPVVSIAK